MSATIRNDLLRLTPEALAQLANLGLVKRAQRELATGYVPALSIADDGRLSAVFPDQVTTDFAPGAGLKEASCSCGATLCRHRIAVLLHYAATTGSNDEAAGAAMNMASFDELDEARVQAQTAASLWAVVEREVRSGISIEVERSLSSDGSSIVYTARLPHATARYYAGADLAFARCDCTAQQRCEHIALGALALKQAVRLADARMTIELGSADAAQRRSALSAQFSSAPYRALLRALLRDGLAHGAAENAATASALNAALTASRALGATWLTLCLEAIEQWLDGYQRRSARFAYLDGVALLRELTMRLAVAETKVGQLSQRAALGLGEAMESALDRLTLISLGLRIHSDGVARRATLAVVDTDTQTLLSLHKTWQRDSDSKESELGLLDQQRVASSLRLARLATGSLVTTTAKRRANGELRLGQSFAGKASIGAQNGDWSRLREPLLIDSQADYLRQQRLVLPMSLAARTALPGFHVLRVSVVCSIGFDPARQRLHALLMDSSDAVWQLHRDYASATPGALDAIAQTLQNAKPDRVPLYVAGRVQRGSSGLNIDPWALSSGAIVVPDVCPANGALAQVLLCDAGGARGDALGAFVRAIDECLCDLLRDGLMRQGSSRARLAELLERSRELGLTGAGSGDRPGIHATLQNLRTHIEQLHSGDHATLETALADVAEVAVWTELAQHAMTSIDNENAEEDAGDATI
jgi:SWIM zinc finger